MRQDLIGVASSSATKQNAVVLVACFLALLTGCQTTNPSRSLSQEFSDWDRGVEQQHGQTESFDLGNAPATSFAQGQNAQGQNAQGQNAQGQNAQARSGADRTRSTTTASSFKPQTDLTTTSPLPYQSTPYQPGNGFTVRGQSGVNRYSASPPQGLPAFPNTTSEATLPAPNSLLNNGPPNNSLVPPPTVQAPASSPLQYGQPSVQAPAGGYQFGGAPPTIQSNQPQPPVDNYNAPGTYGNGYGGNGYGGGGYGGGNYASPSDYGTTIAPGASLPPGAAGGAGTAVAPGVMPYVDPNLGINAPTGLGQRYRERVAPIDVYVQEARTGRIILGGSVNSDLGVAGQLIIDERNFDIRRFPRSWDDLRSGRAFKGGGQNFRAELMPGTNVERYTVSWTERNLLGYLPYSLSVGGFLYTRQFRDWSEQRLGGRVALGYEVTKDISISSELRMEDVKLFNARIAGVPELDDSLGSTDLYTGRVRIARDTRDSPFMSTEGSLLELVYDQVFGERDYSRGAINYSKYFMVRERPDGTGRHVIANTWRVGVTGSQTPIFENYFAGGYSTLRGFSFRGASPVEGGVQVGGEFMFLGSLEYVFPLTADDMLRGVAFVDYGTIEQDLTIDSENFRVAPGLGLRVTVPALGPAPLAFDFAYPINHADTDDRQVFSFFMGFTR